MSRSKNQGRWPVDRKQPLEASRGRLRGPVEGLPKGPPVHHSGYTAASKPAMSALLRLGSFAERWQCLSGSASGRPRRVAVPPAGRAHLQCRSAQMFSTTFCAFSAATNTRYSVFARAERKIPTSRSVVVGAHFHGPRARIIAEAGSGQTPRIRLSEFARRLPPFGPSDG